MWISVPVTQILIKILCTCLCVIVVVGVGLFAVKGYGIEGNDFVVYRLMWKTRFPLNAIVQCWEDPQAMKSSWRVFGNGGFFSFTGLFRNKKLGSFHAYATDPQKSVVVKMLDRIIVVTPDSPSSLIAQLNKSSSSKNSSKS